MRRPLVIFSCLAILTAVAIGLGAPFSSEKWIETEFVRVKVPPGWTEWVTPETPTRKHYDSRSVVDNITRGEDRDILTLGYDNEKYHIDVYRFNEGSEISSKLDRVLRANEDQSETTSLVEFSSWRGISGRGFDLFKTYPLPIHTRARLFEFKQGQSKILITVKAENKVAEKANQAFQKKIRSFEPLLSKIQSIDN